MSAKIKINMNNSYKLGLDEVEGLETAMRRAFEPIKKILANKIYWRDTFDVDTVAYKSCDGFIPHSHNCGGLQIHEIIPECERYEFDFLDFGEWNGEHSLDCKNHNECDCSLPVDGEFDAALRIWFKFEGLDDDDKLNFYLVVSGGNNDAPYFRTKYENTYFKAEFSCSSVNGLQRAASKHIKAIVDLIK